MLLVFEIAGGIVLGFMVLAFWPYVLAIGVVLVALLVAIMVWAEIDSLAPSWPAMITCGLLASAAIIWRKSLWPGQQAQVANVPMTVEDVETSRQWNAAEQEAYWKRLRAIRFVKLQAKYMQGKLDPRERAELESLEREHGLPRPT